MKHVKNKSLANATLNVGGTTYHGDAVGTFAMAPEHAARILGTPGWAEVDAAPQPPTPADPVASLRPPPAPPAPTPPADTQPGPDEDKAEAAEVGPDLDALNKKELLDVASTYGIELSNAEVKLTVSDLRALLSKRLYGDES